MTNQNPSVHDISPLTGKIKKINIAWHGAWHKILMIEFKTFIATFCKATLKCVPLNKMNLIGGFLLKMQRLNDLEMEANLRKAKFCDPISTMTIQPRSVKNMQFDWVKCNGKFLTPQFLATDGATCTLPHQCHISK